VRSRQWSGGCSGTMGYRFLFGSMKSATNAVRSLLAWISPTPTRGWRSRLTVERSIPFTATGWKIAPEVTHSPGLGGGCIGSPGRTRRAERARWLLRSRGFLLWVDTGSKF